MWVFHTYLERKIRALCEDAWPCFTDSASKCCKTGFDGRESSVGFPRRRIPATANRQRLCVSSVRVLGRYHVSSFHLSGFGMECWGLKVWGSLESWVRVRVRVRVRDAEKNHRKTGPV